MSSPDILTEAAAAAGLDLEINVAELEKASKDLVANPANAFVDGSAQILLKYAADVAGFAAKLPIPGLEEAATATADGLTIAASLEPLIARLIENGVKLAASARIGISPDVVARIVTLNAQLDPHDDIFKVTEQPPPPPPTEPAPPANEPDMPAGMRPQD